MLQTEMLTSQGEKTKLQIEGVTCQFSKFYIDSMKQPTYWSMKCRLCDSSTLSLLLLLLLLYVHL